MFDINLFVVIFIFFYWSELKYIFIWKYKVLNNLHITKINEKQDVKAQGNTHRKCYY